MSNAVRSYRRYLLLKIQFYTLMCDNDLASANLAKHDATDGTEFSDAVPFQTELIAAGYTATEDVFGADANELVEQAGLTFDQAKAVLAIITARAGAPSCAPGLVAGAAGQAA